MAHAILSPSSATRWMACPPSARLELEVEDEGSIFAREGTLAHAIAEAIFRNPKRKYTKKDADRLKAEFGEDYKTFYSKEMLRHCENFVNYVLENAPEKHHLFIEHKLDITSHIEEGFGTMDAGLIYLHTDDGIRWYWVLETFDLKYGKGVPVYAEENKQQMIYALGMINDFGYIFEIEKIILHIYQPRILNNSEWEISAEDLKAWGKNELQPAALLAFAGEGDFKAGDHCKFCKVKGQCRALAEYNLALVANGFKEPVFLRDDEILEIFDKEEIFTGWIEAIKNHVLKTAIAGKPWPGYKVVEGRANRRYSDEGKVFDALIDAGFHWDQIHADPVLRNLGDMEAEIGGEDFVKYVVPLLIKPQGKPTLVPLSDDRPPFNQASSTFDDGFFEEEDLSDLM